VTNRALCFVMMPFGKKHDPTGGPDIDFDGIYAEAIEPAIRDADMDPVRADHESTMGIIHKPMFERLLLTDYAVADLTTLNANVFYELGVRHAARRATTVAIYARKHPLPFDLNYLRALSYELGDGNVFLPDNATALRGDLAKRLGEQRTRRNTDPLDDSPVFQLLPEYKPPEIDRLKTDTFRQLAHYSADQKTRLASARRAGDPERLREIERDLSPLDAVDAGVLVDLLLSYRALGAYHDVTRLVDAVPETLRRARMVQEQFAFAENRLGRRDQAIRILEELHRNFEPTSESYSLLGRVYKDGWREQLKTDPAAARGRLDQAIESYLAGFRRDWRDAYPGVNALTLMCIRGADGDRDLIRRLLPVVRFGVEQRFQGRQPDYWDHASLLELAVIEGDTEAARVQLPRAKAAAREDWELESTADNLMLIHGAYERRGFGARWLEEIGVELRRR
jgi:tetratricopeptide (TPR) repeat protein